MSLNEFSDEELKAELRRRILGKWRVTHGCFGWYVITPEGKELDHSESWEEMLSLAISRSREKAPLLWI